MIGTAPPPALWLDGISRQFGRVTALDRATLRVEQGTVHALLGENGAGKTTLMRVAFGLVQPDAGIINVLGRPMHLASPAAALAAGIGMVHQHFTLVPAMTVAENVALGGRGRFSQSEWAVRVRDIGERTGLVLDPLARVEDLSVGAQQRCEIVKALARDVKLLILDEPTAMLAPAEARELLLWTRRFAEQGHTAVLITHKLRDALATADDVTVLRRGKTVLQAAALATSESEVAAVMLGAERGVRSVAVEGVGGVGGVGRDAVPGMMVGAVEPRDFGEAAVQAEVPRGANVTPVARTLAIVATAQRTASQTNAADAPRSELHGTAVREQHPASPSGAATAQQQPQAQAIQPGGDSPPFLDAVADALHPASPATTVIRAVNISVHDSRDVMRVDRVSLSVRRGEIVGVAAVEGSGQRELLRVVAGRLQPTSGEVHLPTRVGFVPEDRHNDALLLDRSLVENVALRDAGARRGRMPWPALRVATRRIIADQGVRAGGEEAEARTLSGGNQQKLILGRELADEPEALVVENPTRGLDFRATTAVHEALRAARAKGTAIVVYSSDLDEVLTLADRVVVMHAAQLRETALDRDAIGRAMLGA